jgi:hypothetical protein
LVIFSRFGTLYQEKSGNPVSDLSIFCHKMMRKNESKAEKFFFASDDGLHILQHGTGSDWA